MHHFLRCAHVFIRVDNRTPCLALFPLSLHAPLYQRILACTHDQKHVLHIASASLATSVFLRVHMTKNIYSIEEDLTMMMHAHRQTGKEEAAFSEAR